MATVHVLTNPTAGRGRGLSAGSEVVAAIRSQGHEVVRLEPDGVSAVPSTVDRARVEGMTRLVVVGGDGLVHHAIGPLVRTDVVVGIIPVGTGNDFARALGLPTRLDDAVTAALGHAAPVDLVAADTGRCAATVVTGGFSGQVNGQADRLRFPSGHRRYTVATVLELPWLRTLDLTLDVDGTVHEHRATLFAVANTRYFGGGMDICPTARPDDGLLDVTIVGPVSRLVLARLLPTVFSGRHVNHPSVTTLRGHCVGLTVDAPLWADGEPFSGSTLRAAPAVLRVAGSLVTA